MAGLDSAGDGMDGEFRKVPTRCRRARRGQRVDSCRRRHRQVVCVHPEHRPAGRRHDARGQSREVGGGGISMCAPAAVSSVALTTSASDPPIYRPATMSPRHGRHPANQFLPVFLLGDNPFKIVARRSLGVGGVANPTLLPQSRQQSTNANLASFFSTYGEDSRICGNRRRGRSIVSTLPEGADDDGGALVTLAECRDFHSGGRCRNCDLRRQCASCGVGGECRLRSNLAVSASSIWKSRFVRRQRSASRGREYHRVGCGSGGEYRRPQPRPAVPGLQPAISDRERQ